MLVYVKQSCISEFAFISILKFSWDLLKRKGYIYISDEVLASVTDDDIPKHLRVKFEKERAEENRKKKEKSEAHLYTEILFVTENDLQRHHGFDLFELRSVEDELPKERVEKELTINDLYEKACKLLCHQLNQKSMGDVVSRIVVFGLFQFTELDQREQNPFVEV